MAAPLQSAANARGAVFPPPDRARTDVMENTRFHSEKPSSAALTPREKEQKERMDKLTGMDKIKPEYQAERTRNSKLDPARPEDIYEPMKKCECSKCNSRLYQDGSADAGVSFKSPTHISPEMSRSAVASHEREHVRRESWQAEKGEMKVVSAQVRLFQRNCKECGINYTSGGVTVVKVRPDVPVHKLMDVLA